MMMVFSLGMQATYAQSMKPKMAGGAMMYASKSIIQNAMHSKDHTTLVAAVKAAELVKTLEDKGPFTVFAPTNEAFDEFCRYSGQSAETPLTKLCLSRYLLIM